MDLKMSQQPTSRARKRMDVIMVFFLFTTTLAKGVPAFVF
jgi:hypothetical protein